MNIKCIIIAFLLTLSSVCIAQSNIFEKYADTEDVTTVYISKKMFQLIPSIEKSNLNLQNMKNKIESLQILTTSKKELIEILRKETLSMTNKTYEELMRIKENDTLTTFYILQKGENINELIMLNNDVDKLTIIQLIGNFTIDDIQEITKNKK
jgi:hypothetical protein